MCRYADTENAVQCNESRKHVIHGLRRLTMLQRFLKHSSHTSTYTALYVRISLAPSLPFPFLPFIGIARPPTAERRACHHHYVKLVAYFSSTWVQVSGLCFISDSQ